MVEARKYEKVRENMPDPVVLEFGRGLIGVQANVSRNLGTNKVYRNITLRGGFKGNFGFVSNKLNASLDLSADVTDSQLEALVAAIKQMRDRIPILL